MWITRMIKVMDQSILLTKELFHLKILVFLAQWLQIEDHNL
jgi:hypothetical protein